MNVRPYTPEDYTHINQWCERRKVDAPIEEALAPLGAVAELDGKPVAVAFLHVTTGKVGFIHQFYANPGNQVRDTRDAGLQLLTYLEAIATSEGLSYIESTTPHEVMAFEVEKLGFAVSPIPVFELQKII